MHYTLTFYLTVYQPSIDYTHFLYYNSERYSQNQTLARLRSVLYFALATVVNWMNNI